MKTCPILAAAAIAGALVKGGQVEITPDLCACKGERCACWVEVTDLDRAVCPGAVSGCGLSR